MERVAAAAGEAHSDHPATAHAWLAQYCRSADDSLDDSSRQLLALLIEPLVGSADLILDYVDAVRVTAAAEALSLGPSPLTAAVFVGTVRLAVEHAQERPRGLFRVEDYDAMVASAFAHGARIAEEAEARARAEQREAARREQEAARREQEEAARRAQQVARATCLSVPTLAAVERLQGALCREQPAPRTLFTPARPQLGTAPVVIDNVADPCPAGAPRAAPDDR